MARPTTRIISIVLLVALVILLFVFYRSCYSGNQPQHLDDTPLQEEVRVLPESARPIAQRPAHPVATSARASTASSLYLASSIRS